MLPFDLLPINGSVTSYLAVQEVEFRPVKTPV